MPNRKKETPSDRRKRRLDSSVRESRLAARFSHALDEPSAAKVETVLDLAYGVYAEAALPLGQAGDVEQGLKQKFRDTFKDQIANNKWPEQWDYVLAHTKILGILCNRLAVEGDAAEIDMAHVERGCTRILEMAAVRNPRAPREGEEEERPSDKDGLRRDYWCP